LPWFFCGDVIQEFPFPKVLRNEVSKRDRSVCLPSSRLRRSLKIGCSKSDH
jgi:hypothetical protein